MTPATTARMKALGLTAIEFASLTGPHPTTISRWEEEPPWVLLLLRSWELCEEALAEARADLPSQKSP